MFLCCLVTTAGLSQDHPLFRLEKELWNGNKRALFDIARYFDSNDKMFELLGYHITWPLESDVAKRIVRENCFFTEEEIQVNDSLTEAQFLDFLNRRSEHITYVTPIAAFLITPLHKRDVTFALRAVPPRRMDELRSLVPGVLREPWAVEFKIDSLIATRKPSVLVTIALEFLRKRNRFNEHPYRTEDFLNLLQYLTGTEIGVNDETGNLSWYIDRDYYPQSRLNLAVYFSKYQNQYSWNETLDRFDADGIAVEENIKERDIFLLLRDPNDSIALKAFIDLTRADPVTVSTIASEYQNANIDVNRSLPIFPYRFVTALSQLNYYCRSHAIDLVGSEGLQNHIQTLRKKLTFAERRRLEDELIETLTMEEVNALEYWSLIHQSSWDLSYSAGRILDIFYSKKWHDVVADPQTLLTYLKKSALFERLGVAGAGQRYLNKFRQSSEQVLIALRSLETADVDIRDQIERIFALQDRLPRHPARSKFWDGNSDQYIKDPQSKLSRLTRQKDATDEIVLVLSKISYDQIPLAIRAIEDYPFEFQWEKYFFLESDFGFFFPDFSKKHERDDFLRRFDELSEFELYAYYLDQAGIRYRHAAGTLDFDRIYDLIKYDVVVALAGGGSKLDNEVYSLIKLLEITFNTTLGFPKKLCQSQNMYACSSSDRVKAWMDYLSEHKFLKLPHDEPMSFAVDGQ